MGFLSPLQLAWIAAIVVVALAYVHWAARKIQPTTTLPIWEHAFDRRAWWSRWRKLVSVFVACVPIVLVAIALAQPFLSPFVESSRTIVVVIDNSASMNAQTRGRSRLEQAKREARKLIRNLRTHDRMAILSADSTVRVRCGLTSDRTALHLGLDAVQPTDGTGAMSDCVATARRLVEDEPRPVVVVVSDGAFHGLEKDEHEEVVALPVGRSENNVAITNLAARAKFGSPEEQEVLVEVANFGDEPVNVTIELTTEDKPITTIDFQLPAGETEQKFASITVDRSLLLTAQIGDEDALSSDNTARQLVVTPRIPRIAVITNGEESPIETAARSLPNVEVERVDALGTATDFDLVIFDGITPDTMPKLPTIVFGPTSSAGFWSVQDDLVNPQAGIVATHPITHDIDLRDVIIDRAVKVDVDSSAKVLAATTSGDPVIALQDRIGGGVVLFAFDVQSSDIRWHDDLPKLIANSMYWLTRERQPTRNFGLTADTLSRPGEFTSPYGDVSANAANLHDVGVWQITEDGDKTILPVNLASNDESDVRRIGSSLRKTWPHISWLPDFGPLWMPLVALALVWMAAQWAFYQRGTID